MWRMKKIEIGWADKDEYQIPSISLNYKRIIMY